MIKILASAVILTALTGCESSGQRYQQTPQQQAANLQMMQLGAQLLNQSNPAPPPARTPVQCTSTPFGYSVQTTCY